MYHTLKPTVNNERIQGNVRGLCIFFSTFRWIKKQPIRRCNIKNYEKVTQAHISGKKHTEIKRSLRDHIII